MAHSVTFRSWLDGVRSRRVHNLSGFLSSLLNIWRAVAKNVYTWLTVEIKIEMLPNKSVKEDHLYNSIFFLHYHSYNFTVVMFWKIEKKIRTILFKLSLLYIILYVYMFFYLFIVNKNITRMIIIKAYVLVKFSRW